MVADSLRALPENVRGRYKRLMGSDMFEVARPTIFLGQEWLASVELA